MIRRRPTLPIEQPSTGFQLAPMVDVVFVIMLFFMATAWSQKVERQLSLRLPGGPSNATGVEFPDELMVAIENDGTVLLNDEPLAMGADRRMNRLATVLQRLREQGTAGRQPLATLEVEADALYERMMDVLGALSRAGIHNVTLVQRSPI